MKKSWLFGATVSAVLVAGALAPVVAWARPAQLAVADAGSKPAPVIDLNSAGEEQLRTLPGVGPARAQAIIAGRPYAGKDDLVKRNILPKNVYEGVKDRIVAKQK
jgi:DNA uptake protein ComE-like DNA-binding protein